MNNNVSDENSRKKVDWKEFVGRMTLVEFWHFQNMLNRHGITIADISKNRVEFYIEEVYRNGREE